MSDKSKRKSTAFFQYKKLSETHILVNPGFFSGCLSQLCFLSVKYCVEPAVEGGLLGGEIA